MADDADDLLEKWLASGQELLAARKGSRREAELEQRIADLEARFADRPADEQEEALEELTEAEWELVRAHRAAGQQAPPAAEETPPAEEKPKRTRPGRRAGSAYRWTVDDDGRVQKTDIPVVYNGPDEPGEVELPDDEQEEAAA